MQIQTAVKALILFSWQGFQTRLPLHLNQDHRQVSQRAARSSSEIRTVRREFVEMAGKHQRIHRANNSSVNCSGLDRKTHIQRSAWFHTRSWRVCRRIVPSKAWIHFSRSSASRAEDRNTETHPVSHVFHLTPLKEKSNESTKMT